MNKKYKLRILGILLLVVSICSCSDNREVNKNILKAQNETMHQLDGMSDQELAQEAKRNNDAAAFLANDKIYDLTHSKKGDINQEEVAKEKQILLNLSNQGNAWADYWLGVRCGNEDICKIKEVCETDPDDNRGKSCGGDYTESDKYFEEAADKGLVKAQMVLVKSYLNTYMNSIKQDKNLLSKAQKYAEDATFSGSATAPLYVITIMITDNGSIPSIDSGMANKMLRYAKLSILNQNDEKTKPTDANAYYVIANILRVNSFTFSVSIKDYDDQQADKRILEYFNKAANLGNPEAEVFAGDQQYRQKEYSQAHEWYLKAKDQNYLPAYMKLAEMYHDGKGVDKNIQKYNEFIKGAAEQGLPNAQFKYAQVFKNNNQNEYISWLEKAAKGSKDHDPSVDALYDLSVIYIKGGYGLPVDSNKSFNLIRKFYRISNDSDRLNNYLSNINFNSLSSEQAQKLYDFINGIDYGIKDDYYIAAAIKTDNAKLIFKQGERSGLNPKQKFEIYTAAEKFGMRAANEALLKMYHDYNSYSYDREKYKDYPEILTALIKYCASRGNAQAQFEYALTFKAKDAKVYLKWLDAASRKNFPEADIVLSLIYLQGTNGVDKDFDKSMRYLNYCINSNISNNDINKLYLSKINFKELNKEQATKMYDLIKKRTGCCHNGEIDDKYLNELISQTK